MPELATKGARHIEELTQTIDENSDHREVLDNIKQLALYSDVFSNCKWSSPSDAINKELAGSIINIAKIMIGTHDRAMTTQAELEIWVKHLKPVWKKDAFQMKQALINCYQEAESLGLIEQGSTEQMSSLVL